MKKFISAFLSLCTLTTPLLVGCGGGGSSSPKSESKIAMWTAHGYDKIRTEARVPSNPETTYTVSLAKNETESANIAIRSSEDTGLLSFKTLSGECEHIEVKAYHIMEILKRSGKRWTDPAAPLGAGKRFKLTKDETMAVLIDFKTTKDTPAGDYTYEFGVVDSKGNVLNKVTITVHVWNFAMPDNLTFQTAVGNSIVSVDRYEMLLEHNLTPYKLPYDILDERADAYMSDPRVTSFLISIDYSKEDYIETTTAYVEKIRTNEDWLAKAYFYPIDEPSTTEQLEKFETRVKELRELFPDVKITVPYYKNLQVTDELDQIDFMDQYIDLHCPKLANWDDDVIYSAEQKEKYPSFAERMKAIQEKGETVWAYVCNYPLAPYLNVKVDDEGIVSRVLFWQFYQRDIDGFLYWSSDTYRALPDRDPWKSVDTFGNGIYGDGILIYTGKGAGLPEVTPVGSIRLKIIRDGIDDIELLYMAEELFGREWVDERANKVSKSLTTVDVTSEQFAAIRIEIGNAIEAELNK